VALDMESATIAANGFRFRVPYGTLLCVSDKPLHGEIKLPGMANHFYRERVDQHLRIGIRAMELLRAGGVDQLHSRKLRSFAEVAFQSMTMLGRAAGRPFSRSSTCASATAMPKSSKTCLFTSPRANAWASSAPTAQAKPPPSACAWGHTLPDGGTITAMGLQMPA